MQVHACLHQVTLQILEAIARSSLALQNCNICLKNLAAMPNMFLAGARVEITVVDLASLMLDIGKHVHVCPEPRLKQELILHDLLPWDVGLGGGVPLQHPHNGDDFVTTDDSGEKRRGSTIFLDTLVPTASTEVGIDTFTVCDPWQGAFLSEVRPKLGPKFDAWNSYKQCSGHTTAARSSFAPSLSMALPEFDTKSEHVAGQGILEEDLLITSPTDGATHDDEQKEELQKKAVPNRAIASCADFSIELAASTIEGVGQDEFGCPWYWQRWAYVLGDTDKVG